MPEDDAAMENFLGTAHLYYLALDGHLAPLEDGVIIDLDLNLYEVRGLKDADLGI